MSVIGQKLQTPHCKINKYWGCNELHDNSRYQLHDNSTYQCCMIYLKVAERVSSTILQCIHMLNHYAIHLKLIQCCMSVISQYNWKKNKLDMSLSKLQKIVKDREAWHAVVQGVTT